jgi:hypothetical protein
MPNIAVPTSASCSLAVARDGARLPVRRHLPVAALQSEGGLDAVSPEDRRARELIAGDLRGLPRDALLSLRHFQAQIGCLNRCGFCSQGAGTTLWQLSRNALANLIAAIKMVALEYAVQEGRVGEGPLNAAGTFSDSFEMPASGLIASDRNDRPGVIYCYLDNDPSAYPSLDALIDWLHADLGVKTRIATVGYSRLNTELQQMHERICRDLMHAVGGLRLSISPYTYGWTKAAEAVGAASRQDFEADTANLLDTYRHAFLSNREGRKGACVELRFKPLVVEASMDVDEVLGHRVLCCGPYLVVAAEAGSLPNVAKLCNPHSHTIDLSEPGFKAWMVYALEEELKMAWREIAEAVVAGNVTWGDAPVCSVVLHTLSNEDGIYFAVNAERNSSGVHAKYFYPKTLRRKSSGYIDGERYFLNELIAANKSEGAVSWDAVTALLSRLGAKSDQIEAHDPIAATYIRSQVIDLVESYANSLRLADYPARAFFDKEVTVDTGHICNLGRAFNEYRAIASRPNLPLTPNHERAFGASGELAQEGVAWRLAVTPVTETIASIGACGARNEYQTKPSILIEELDLSMTSTEMGQRKRRYFIEMDGISAVSLRESRALPIIPGHKAKN